MGPGEILRGKLGPLSAVVLTACVSGAVTLAAVLVPDLHLAYREPSLRVALETASALIGLLVAYLVYGRARRSLRPDELVLALGLVWLAGSNLLLAATVAFIPTLNGLRSLVFAGAAAGAVLVATAAVVPVSALASHRLGRFLPLGAIALTALVSVGLYAVLGDVTQAGEGLHPAPSSHPELLVTQALTMVAFGVAAIGFARRAARTDDSFLYWVAAAMTLACFSRANYVMYPPVRPQWVYLGDGFRVLSYSVLLVAAVREIRGYWQRIADTAVLEERRRLARDIHDSIAQELAYISRRARQLSTAGALGMEISAAAERGLVESRRAMSTLAQRPVDEPFELELSQVIEMIAAREKVNVTVQVDRPLRIRADQRATLLGIAREAVANAARHGRAGTIHVEVVGGRNVRLRVADDGAGFDATEAMLRGAGFGLRSMKELALALGADFQITSGPGLGTEIRVVLQ